MIPVYILSFNNEAMLRKCVLHYNEAGIRPIVVDNCSTDVIPYHELSCSVLRLPEPLSFSAAYNWVFDHAQEAGHEYFICSNNDVFVEEDTVKRMVEFYETHDNVGAVGCCLHFQC